MITSATFPELERSVNAALETYSNVHRGSGHFSMVTTHLYEQARDIVLEHLGLNKKDYVVIFCSPRRAAILAAQLVPGNFQVVSSLDLGLPLGLRAVAARRNALPAGSPFQTGGGTTRLVGRDWVKWANAPEKFEAGTPAIINIIAFARALQLTGHTGNNTFTDTPDVQLTVADILHSDELQAHSGRKLLDELRLRHIGRGVVVPTMEGPRPYINLDNGASTPTFAPVWNAVCQTWRQSQPMHQELVRATRTICSEVLGAPLPDYEVIFTSNTTEAINLVAESLKNKQEIDTEPVVLTTLLEHSSNDLPWRSVSRSPLSRLSIDAEGFIDPGELDSILCAYNKDHQYGNRRIRLVSVTGASNVLGTYNDLAEISRIVHHYGAHLLVDAAQMVAHRKIDMEECGIDYLAFCAHKVYAPFGCGVLVARKGLLLFNEAVREQVRSSGEENAVGIAALGKSLRLLQRIGFDLIQQEEQALTALLLTGMSKVNGLTIYGVRDVDSPRFAGKGGVVAFSLKGMMADRIAKELALQGGIGVRYGCHCAHILVKHLVGISPPLERFQRMVITLFPRIQLPGLARVSLGIQTSREDIDTVISVLGKIASKAKNHRETEPTSEKNSTTTLSSKAMKRKMNDFIRERSQKVYRLE